MAEDAGSSHSPAQETGSSDHQPADTDRDVPPTDGADRYQRDQTSRLAPSEDTAGPGRSLEAATGRCHTDAASGEAGQSVTPSGVAVPDDTTSAEDGGIVPVLGGTEPAENGARYVDGGVDSEAAAPGTALAISVSNGSRLSAVTAGGGSSSDPAAARDGLRLPGLDSGASPDHHLPSDSPGALPATPSDAPDSESDRAGSLSRQPRFIVRPTLSKQQLKYALDQTECHTGERKQTPGDGV